MLDKAIRELDRERSQLQNEEKKLINEIKKAAKQNQMVRALSGAPPRALVPAPSAEQAPEPLPPPYPRPCPAGRRQDHGQVACAQPPRHHQNDPPEVPTSSSVYPAAGTPTLAPSSMDPALGLPITWCGSADCDCPVPV